MRLGILSDSHNNAPRVEQAVQLLKAAGAEALVHCGDLAGAPIVAALSLLPAWFVFGNHDSDAVQELEQAARQYGPVCLGWGGTFCVADRRIGVVHGHLTTDVRRVLSEHPHYLLSGHSHEPHDFVENGVRRINPGALYRAATFTVAVLDVESGALKSIEVPRYPINFRRDA